MRGVDCPSFLAMITVEMICQLAFELLMSAWILFFQPILFKLIKARENMAMILRSRVSKSLEISNIIFFVKIKSNFL
jgi:hypothetical protein